MEKDRVHCRLPFHPRPLFLPQITLCPKATFLHWKCVQQLRSLFSPQPSLLQGGAQGHSRSPGASAYPQRPWELSSQAFTHTPVLPLLVPTVA